MNRTEPAGRQALAALLAPLEQLRLVPVRHHSPRCAHHLRALMQSFRPTHVLIEGPAELNALLPALQHAQARPPLAAYLHASVPAGDALEDWRCRCYVPFAAFSPEWVALREAASQGATVRFIDQPYAARLAGAGQPDHFAQAPEPTLGDEPAHQAPDMLEGLVQAGGCGDFDEWWDRHFESGAAAATAQDYFAGVLAFSLLLREQAGASGGKRRAGGPEPDMDQDMAREAHMAAEVGAALAEGGRCLVVCGGFHVPGIVEGLRTPAGQRPPGRQPPACEVGAHLIAYTLARLERASGYAAGMPAPGYYQQVWQAWENGAERPDEAAWPPMAARVVNALRARNTPASLPDAAEAVRMAHGLAALRGCHGGRSELLQALHSAVFKDAERSPALALRAAGMSGDDEYGQLPPNATVAPLLADTLAFCERHRLPSRPALAVRKELDIYRSARHRRISQGLHRLRFLGVPYAQLQSGPDFVAGTGLARVREVWLLGWQVETAVALTEAMCYGASLEEAAINRLFETLARTAETRPAQCVLHVLVMGLQTMAEPVLDVVQAWVAKSHDALALAQATGSLALAFETRHALGGVGLPRLAPLLRHCFAQACLRLPWLGEGDQARQHAALDALADLHGMVCRNAPWADARLLHEACLALHASDSPTAPHVPHGRSQAPALVRGAAAGILSVAGHWGIAQAHEALHAALGLSQVQASDMGEYLQGFLRVARAWLLGHPPLLRLLSERIAGWSEDAFLSGLPALRLAFAQLTRADIRLLAQRLAAAPGAALLPASRPAQAVPSAAATAHSRAFAAQVAGLLAPWGLS